jgi:hypothetical protein
MVKRTTNQRALTQLERQELDNLRAWVDWYEERERAAGAIVANALRLLSLERSKPITKFQRP